MSLAYDACAQLAVMSSCTAGSHAPVHGLLAIARLAAAIVAASRRGTGLTAYVYSAERHCPKLSETRDELQ